MILLEQILWISIILTGWEEIEQLYFSSKFCNEPNLIFGYTKMMLCDFVGTDTLD